MLGGEKAAVAFHGDHRPASIYVDEQVIFEPSESTQEGTALTFDRTYNDRAEVSVFGESVQETLTGKNLLPYFENPYIGTITSDGDGKWYTVNTAGWNTVTQPSGTDHLIVEPGTYTVTFIAQEGASKRFYVRGFGKDVTSSASQDYKTYVSLSTEYVAGTYTATFDVVEGYEQLLVASTSDSVSLIVGSKFAIQLESGTTATTYEPYCGGIPAPNPSYPMPIVSRASACVETSNADGSKTSTTDLTSLLNGRELRSLPDGTRDELQVRDNGDGTGDVVLVGKVHDHAFSDSNGVSYTTIDGGIRLSFRDLPSSAEEESGTSITKSICEFGNISNAQWYKGVQSGACTASKGYGTVGKINVFVGGVESLSDAINVIEGMKIQYALATPTETVLGTIPMPETFYDTTHVWEANGADISARVKVAP